MSDEPELTPEEAERRLHQILDQVLDQVLGEASNRVTLARMHQNMEHLLVERALAEGVAPHVTMEALDLSMEADGPLVWCVSRNMFTLLLILGLVRDRRSCRRLPCALRTNPPVAGRTGSLTSVAAGCCGSHRPTATTP